jgi:hypothetical protein
MVAIKYLSLVNKALGVKILWRLVTEGKSWWKTILLNKYLSGVRERFLDKEPTSKRKSNICKLCKEEMPLIMNKLTWIPGKGNCIKI